MNNNISITLKSDLCTGCGICEGACLSNAITITVEKGVFRPTIDVDKCKNCGRCFKSCPGIGIDLEVVSSNLFATGETKKNKEIGRYISCFSGYSNDNSIRLNSASGGVLSQFLIWLLENDIIDGAVVSKFDKKSPLKVSTFIATNREDVLSAKSSKYSPVSHNKTAQLIKESNGNRFVVVGLPCHIHGFRKLEIMDKSLREKIVGHFSLFCSGSQTFNYTEYILNKSNIRIEEIDYLAYREGSPSGMVAKGENINFFKKYQDYNKPLKSTFYPRRCNLCVDFQGELADIALGDLMQKEGDDFGTGINAIIIRSTKWLMMFNRAVEDGTISANEITEDRLNYKRPMVKVKKNQNASFVELLRKLGKVVPDYGFRYDGHISVKTGIKYFSRRIKQLIGTNKKLWFMLPSIK